MQRKCFSVSIPYLIKENGLTKIDIGTISSWFSLNYGIAKFIGGIISDIIPSGTLFFISILFASISVIGFGYSSSNITMLYLLWSVNGFSQGLLGPAMTKYVCDNYNNNNNNTKMESKSISIFTVETVWSIIICAGNIGYLIGPYVLIPLINYNNWQYCFKALGFVGIILAIIIHILMRKGNDNNMKIIDNKIIDQNNQFVIIFQRAQFWATVISSFLSYFVLKTMADWTYLYLVEYYKMNVIQSTELMLYNEMGGIFGTILAGTISLSLGQLPTSIIFCFICSLSLYSLQYCSIHHAAFKILLFLAGAGVNGPKTLIPLTIKDFSGKYSGTIGGIIGLINQLGCVMAGAGVGIWLERNGWDYYLPFLILNIISVVFFLMMAYFYSNDKKIKYFKKID